MYLDPRLCEADPQRQLLTHEDVRVVSLAERSFQLAQLRRSKARPVSLLLERLSTRRRRAAAARRQRQRALVLVLARRRRRRRGGGHRRPLVVRRPRALQRVLGPGYQVSAARHVRLGQFAVVARSEAAVVVVVIVVVVAVAAAGAVAGGEVSLTVFVMIVQKHFGDCLIRSAVTTRLRSACLPSSLYRSTHSSTKPIKTSIYIQYYNL